MKKMISGFVCLAMLLSFASCSIKSNGQIVFNNNSEPSSVTDDNSLPSSLSSGGNKSEAVYTRGEWTENVYKSEFLQLSYTLPDTWVRASDEELDAIMEQSMGLVTDNSAIAEKAAEKIIYEFMVQDPITGTNIYLLLENLAGGIGADFITEKTYYEIVKAQMESDAYAGMEFETDGVLNEHTINNNKYYYAKQTLKVQDVKVNQFVVIRKIDKYMAFASLSAMNGETFEDLIKNFS